MEKEKRILFYFIVWFIVAICIFLVGVINAKADTYTASQFEAKLFDNYGPSLSGVSTSSATGGWSGTIPSMTANSSGAAWGFSSPIPIVANHTYAMSVIINGSYGGNLTLSTYNRIGIGSSMTSAEESYEGNTKVKEVSSKAIPSADMLQFVFTAESSASYIVFPFATTYSGSNQNYVFASVIIDDLGSNSLTQSEINNSLTNQTNTLNNSINNSTNIITGEIDNLGEDIKDSFNTCKPSSNLINYTIFNSADLQSDGYYYVGFPSSGSILNGSFKANTSYTISFYGYRTHITSGFAGYFIFIYSDGTRDTIGVNSSTPTLYKFTTPSNKTISYISMTYGNDNRTYLKDLMLNEGGYKGYEPYGGEVCNNKIDETNDKLDQTNDKLDNLTGAITDDSSPNIDGLGDSAGWLPPGPLDSVLNLPLSLFNSLTTNLNKSCSPVSIPLPYVKKDLTIPCINTLYEKIGVSTFITWLGVIVSGLMLYTYLLKLYKWIEDRISLNETHSVDNWGGL